jgi:Coenzyme PQQ synthesis protein D (PqqD)
MNLFRSSKRTRPAETRRFSLSPDVRASVCDGGVVFLAIRKGVVFRSNRVGAAIWKGLQEGHDVAAVSAAISAEYGVSREDVERDASQFIAALTAEGLLAKA